MRITHKSGYTCYRTSRPQPYPYSRRTPLALRRDLASQAAADALDGRHDVASRCRRRSASGRPRSAPGARRRPRSRRRPCTRASAASASRVRELLADQYFRIERILGRAVPCLSVGRLAVRFEQDSGSPSGRRPSSVSFSSSPPIEAIATPATASTTTTPTAISHLILTVIESTSRRTRWQRSYESSPPELSSSDRLIFRKSLILFAPHRRKSCWGSAWMEPRGEHDEQTTPRPRARADALDHRGRGRRRRRGRREAVDDDLHLRERRAVLHAAVR